MTNPTDPPTGRSADARPSRGRRTAFRILAGVMGVSGAAFGLFTAVFGVVSEAQRIHAFHNAVVASLLIVLSALPALAVARIPERSGPALAQLTAVGVAGAVTMILALTADPFTLPFIVLVGVLWLLRPGGEPVVSRGRPSPLLLVLVLGAAVPLVLYALNQAEISRIDRTSEHAEFYHWVETSFYAIAVLLVGLLAGIRPVHYRLLSWSAGIALAVMGGASVAFPGRASALQSPWGWIALAGGAAFVAASEVERHRLGPRTPVPPGTP